MENVEQFIKKHFKKSTNRNDKYHIETIYKSQKAMDIICMVKD